jgi:hypothetical protein
VKIRVIGNDPVAQLREAILFRIPSKAVKQCVLGVTKFLWLDSWSNVRSGGGDEGLRVELELSVDLGVDSPHKSCLNDCSSVDTTVSLHRI